MTLDEARLILNVKSGIDRDALIAVSVLYFLYFSSRRREGGRMRDGKEEGLIFLCRLHFTLSPLLPVLLHTCPPIPTQIN